VEHVRIIGPPSNIHVSLVAGIEHAFDRDVHPIAADGCLVLRGVGRVVMGWSVLLDVEGAVVDGAVERLEVVADDLSP
jgi:hypothetical protein